MFMSRKRRGPTHYDFSEPQKTDQDRASTSALVNRLVDLSHAWVAKIVLLRREQKFSIEWGW